MKHCCDKMRLNVNSACDQHADRFDCPDALIVYNDRFQEYGIIIHDGGRSVVQISFCPWCGLQLPTSVRQKDEPFGVQS